MEEYIDIVDEQSGLPTGEILEKSVAHELGKWHATSHVWIYNSKGEILLQKRALIKSTFPGLWDISVAGHISAGESPELGACREAAEEVGLSIGENDLEKIFIFKESHYHEDIDWYNNEFHHVFIYLFDGQLSDLTLQEEEVDDVRFISIDDFKNELSDAVTSASFVNNNDYFQKIISTISSKLKD